MLRHAALQSVVLDGLNIALPKGSGIATYSRNLSRVLQSLGHPVDVLYDREVPQKRWADRLAVEQSFYARQRDADLLGGTRLLSRAGSQVRGAGRFVQGLVRGAKPIRADGPVVLQRGGLPNHPVGAGILTSGKIFRHASAALEMTGKPLTVRLPADALLHLTSPIPLVARNAPTLLTVHDLIPLRMPYSVIDPHLRFLRTMRALLGKVDHVIATSESAKRDLVQIMGVDEGRVTVVYPAVRPPSEFDAALAPTLIEEIYGLTPGDYFLFAGAVEPKKNLPRLIEAYMASGARSPLVLVGPPGWMVEEQLKPLRKFQALQRRLSEQRGTSRGGKRVHTVGWVPAMHLAALMSHARALLFPSIYEGFGLPIIEAMQLGTPVLTATLSAMTEVAGDAAVMVDAFDEGAIARGIAMLDADADLRAHLSEAGRKNALRFSDENCAEMLARAYRNAGIGSVPVREPMIEPSFSASHWP